MFEQTGVPSAEMIMRKFPTVERINRGKVAVVECYKRIPCNPCQTACRFGAIEVGSDINNIPELNAEACTGCGLCVSRCPGLAIMIVDGSADPQSVDIQIPYEFVPLPDKGETVRALDRAGAFVCMATVVDVKNPAAFDRTPVICIRVPRGHMYSVRNIALEA
jgi:Fe-S-cluster-containing hydrogenase component 2